ncbi:MAG TPA: PA14 domain-containing protein [Verrucomicrobiae bacterium]|nr:PA14 domain-containing protein [Verrucomicrobiae bacterium]
MKQPFETSAFRKPLRALISNATSAALWVFVLAGAMRPLHAADHQVQMHDYYFDPQFLAVTVGDSVTWKNFGGEHTATSDDAIFDSDITAFEEEYTFTFSDEGSFPYHCSLHGEGGIGMFGIILVTGSADNTAPETPINLSPADGATNQPVALQLRATPYVDADGVDFHATSQWVLSYASNNAVALDSGPLTGSLTNYHPPGLAEGTAYDWQVRYKDGRGKWSGYSVPTRFRTLVSHGLHGQGLKASYHNVPEFNSPLVVTTNSGIQFLWGTARPHRRITADAFAARWEGSVLPEFTEPYQFQFQFHGRARVWVNQELVIDEWEGCSMKQTRRGFVPLIGGQLAALRVDYVADAAGAEAVLRWESPHQTREVIPMLRLFPFSP